MAERLTYPVATIAKLLELTDRRVQQLATDGVIPKAERGRYDLIATVQGYVRFLRERAFGAVANTDSHTEKTRLTAAQANIAEMQEAEMRGELVRAEEIYRELYTLTRTARNGLLTIADRISVEVAAESDHHTVHEMIENEVETVMAEMLETVDELEPDIEPEEDTADE